MNSADLARLRSAVCRCGSIAKLRIGVAVLLVSVSALLASPASTALAQNPSHTGRMEDVNPGSGYPGTDAVVVEGLGTSTSCAPDVSAVEQATVAFLNAGRRTITEISPQSYCNSLGDYEQKISRIVTYVETNSGNITGLWGGFMLDEEPGFGFSSTDLEALNDYTKNTVNHIAGTSWWWTENQPNGWDLATYNYLVGNSYASPQVYSESMADAVNSECSTYGMCTNNVTVDSAGGAPWDQLDYVTGLINGPCVTEWGICFANLWQPT